MKSFAGFLVVGIVLTFGGRADAQVVTFDELSPTDNPILGSVTCVDGTGFRFVSDHFHLIGGTVVQDFSSNGTTYIGYESGRGFPVTMERVGGGTFSLFSLDVAEFYNAPTDRPDAEMLTITGVQQGGGTVSHTVTVDGIRDGAGGVADFEHVVLPATFVNLTSVVFTGLRAGGLSGGVAVDNIEYQLPQPETLAACVATPLPPDAPTVSIASPLAGNVSGTVLVEAVATDNLGIASVQFRLDEVDLGASDVAAPYSLSWDTTTVADGPHTITAEARDAAGNVATASVVVTVRNQTVVDTTPHHLDIDGVDDYLQVADANGLSFGTGAADSPLTFEMWLRPDAMVRHQLLGKWASGSEEYKLHIASGAIRLDLRDASAQATVSAFTTGSQTALIGGWHHLAVTYDGRGGAAAANGITIYVDGVAAPLTRFNNAAYVAMENSTAPLQIGREGPNWKQFDGALDELRMWSVARTASEIQSYMTTELGGAEPGLAAYWKFNEGSGATADDASPAGSGATLFNGPAWVAGGPMGPAVPDETAPEITSIVTGSLTDTSITVSFSTSEAATGWVSYGAVASCPCTDVQSAGPGTTHVVTLTGLAPDTDYHFVVKATDGAGNLRVAPAMSFRTLTPVPDAAAPTVSIQRPAAGHVSGAAVVIEATAADNIGVAGVQFKLDGVDLGAPDAAPPYSISWDTTTVADGPHTLTAEARDAAGNVGTASVALNVTNTPAPTSPHFVDLDGVDDYLQVADAAGLSFGNGTADTALTFEAWIRPDAMVRHQLLGKWADASNPEYKLHIASGVIRLDLRDASAGTTISAFTTGSQTALVGGWHHLAVTYDGRGGTTAADGITIYVDGSAVPLTRFNNAAYVAMENLTAPLQIGREGPNWKQYDGGLDELRLWNVARTASAIQASMSTELSGLEPGLVAYWRFDDGAGTTVADGSPASHTASMFGGPVWVAGGPMAPAEPDVTAPAITDLATTNRTDTGITIAFSTSETATAWISYATGASWTDVHSAGPGTAHVVTLAGLDPDTEYHFAAKATDAAGNLQVGPTMTFRTLAPSPDATAPTVAMAVPTAGNVSGTTVIVEATAADNVGVVSVQFKLDGVNLGTPDAAAPYAMSWDTTGVADGPHTLAAEARDAAGNVSTASVLVNVANTPAPTSPHFVDLDGVDDYLQAADANGLSFGNGASDTPLTFEAWVRPDAMVRHHLLGKWGDGSSTEYKLHIASGVIRLDLRDASAQVTVSAFTTNSQMSLVGSWHHLAVTYDGRGGGTAADGIRIYIDGVAVALTRFNNAAYVAMENSTAPLQIGREGPNWKQYDGALDELRLWNVARTASEIQSSMSTPLSGVEPGLVAYWRFDEGAGTAALDGSPANHTATLFNGPAWVAGGR